MSIEDLTRIEKAICPGESACGGMYTANAMACIGEALGMSLPGSVLRPRQTAVVMSLSASPAKP
jgi:dihydroxy-acid dehydratase